MASATGFGFEDVLLAEDVPFAVGVVAEPREDGEDPWTIHLVALDKDADRCRDPGAALDCGFEGFLVVTGVLWGVAPEIDDIPP